MQLVAGVKTDEQHKGRIPGNDLVMNYHWCCDPSLLDVFDAFATLFVHSVLTCPLEENRAHVAKTLMENHDSKSIDHAPPP